jgi:hypothetical protein
MRMGDGEGFAVNNLNVRIVRLMARVIIPERLKWARLVARTD